MQNWINLLWLSYSLIFLNWINPWQSETQNFPFDCSIVVINWVCCLTFVIHSLIINGIFLVIQQHRPRQFLQLLVEKIWSVSKIPTIIVIKMQRFCLANKPHDLDESRCQSKYESKFAFINKKRLNLMPKWRMSMSDMEHRKKREIKYQISNNRLNSRLFLLSLTRAATYNLAFFKYL